MARKIDSELVKKLYIKYLRKTKRGYETQWKFVEADYEKATGQVFKRTSLRNHVRDIDPEQAYREYHADKKHEKSVNTDNDKISVVTPKSELRNRVVENMKSLGVYRKEFEDVINIYVNMLHRLKHLYKEFEESGYEVEVEYTNKAGATNYRKTPLYLSIEKLENDIITYSDRLCLNPRAIENITKDEGTNSKLDEALMRIGERYS